MTDEGVYLFVYGTLMLKEENVVQMEGARFLGEGQTVPGWTLYQLDGYPGLAAKNDAKGVLGEVWWVPAELLLRLDDFEGVSEGLYRRISIELTGVWAGQRIETYRHGAEGVGRSEIGSSWREFRQRDL